MRGRGPVVFVSVDETGVVDEHQFEDDLEPRHLIRRSDVILKAGILMLGAGTSSLRVRELMRVVAASLGVDRLRAQIGYTEIVATVERRGIFRTQVAEIPKPGVNAARIAELQDLIYTLPPRTTAGDIADRLRAIEARPPHYRPVQLIPLVGAACAAVCVLTNGGVQEVIAVFFAAMLGYALLRLLTKFQVNHLAAVATAAAVSCGSFVLLTHLIELISGQTSPRLAAGFVCAAIFLIPGFPLITSGLDLARIDLPAGVTRITYAMMVLLSIAIGVWMVAAVSGVSPDVVTAPPGPPVLVWAVHVVASFTAVFGWATMFNCPPKAALAAGIVGAIANVPRLLMLENGVPNHVATFTGCFVIGIGCAIAGSVLKLTKIIMTVPSVLVSIPGSSALRTLLYFDQRDVTSAVQNGVATVLVVIGMVAGLASARMLTDPEWAFTRPAAAPHVDSTLTLDRPQVIPQSNEDEES